MAVLITTTGSVVDISSSGERWTIEEIRKILGGASVPTYIGRGEVLFSNPNRSLPKNLTATNIMIQRIATFNEMLYGDVIRMSLKEEPT